MVHSSPPHSGIGPDSVRLSISGIGYRYGNIRPECHPYCPPLYPSAYYTRKYQSLSL
ncbi:hypothetical protein RHMOL_Rhmol05G0163800 [Rhododendron molle]|uniref:Uncharacterized protein n=1 Tax=Rhododendron molle TaxID=49168 RepID=A0ACC0NPX0_RHOML|nr:hypothetical protein RHMOL_Rhmol05G0163800 [Rhododendron molle]